jgi:hypothetical protein
MTDLLFDFNINDIVLDNGVFEESYTVSKQNATLIFNKSAASITYPQFGVGFEEIYPYLPASQYGVVEATGERQIMNDGALYATITISKVPVDNETRVEIVARYKGE